MLRFGIAQDRGARSRQEDAAVILRKPSVDLVIVADGMGGAPGGDRASRIILAEFAAYWLSQEAPGQATLMSALAAADDAIDRVQHVDPTVAGMGSTLLAAAFWPNGLSWISVGDCLMYLWRAGRLTRLNADHSMAQVLAQMARDGEITQDEALAHPDRNMLLSAMTGRGPRLVDQSEHLFALEPGDCLLFATDGILTLDGGVLAAHLSDDPLSDPQTTADALMAAVRAARRDGQDNTTLILGKFDPAPRNSTALVRASSMAQHVGAILLGLLGLCMILVLLAQTGLWSRLQ